jgi:hypothetical protein
VSVLRICPKRLLKGRSKGRVRCSYKPCRISGLTWPVEAWNTRAAPENILSEATQELLDALEAILEDAAHILHHTPHLGNDYFEKARSAVAEATDKKYAVQQREA